MSIDWSTFERPSEYNRWKPETEGQIITGLIKSIRVATMPDGNKYPSLTITVDGNDVEVLASQTMLLRQLAETKPTAGDKITIQYTRLEKLNGGKTMKHFTVKVERGAPVDPNGLV